MTEVERQIFSQLSVFRGGFTRQAAQEVASASLRLLGKLVSKSLVQYSERQRRYQVHELLRQYGESKLAEDSARRAERAEVEPGRAI